MVCIAAWSLLGSSLSTIFNRYRRQRLKRQIHDGQRSTVRVSAGLYGPLSSHVRRSLEILAEHISSRTCRTSSRSRPPAAPNYWTVGASSPLRILLVVEIALFLFLAAGTHGLIVPLAKPTSTDFVSFYAAGSLADAGTPQLAYDRDAHYAAEERATQPGIVYNFFYYPPVFLLLCAAARPPALSPAFVVFEASTLGLYILVMRRILGERSWAVLMPIFAFPPVLWTIGLGQNGFLTAGLFGSATLLIDRRPFAAGLLFGALCFKPHFALLVPVALAAGGRWRAFAAAFAGCRPLLVVAGRLFGWQTWHAFLTGGDRFSQLFTPPGEFPSAALLPRSAAPMLLGATGLSPDLCRLSRLVAAAASSPSGLAPRPAVADPRGESRFGHACRRPASTFLRSCAGRARRSLAVARARRKYRFAACGKAGAGGALCAEPQSARDRRTFAFAGRTVHRCGVRHRWSRQLPFAAVGRHRALGLTARRRDSRVL